MQLSPELIPIAEKLNRHECLTAEDGLLLYRSPHLVQVGMLAEQERLRRHGTRVSYIINRHLNPTNICALRCPLCAFSRSEGEDGAFCHTIDELLAMAETYRGHHPAEFHIVGGLHPGLPFSFALDMLAALHERFPDVALKAYTAVEIAHWARQGGLSIRECLEQLQQTGLQGLTGGGAEIFAPRVRAVICPGKLPAHEWLAIHGEAHKLGMPTTATMLYGHIETLEERVDHLLLLREQQQKTAGFTAFVPLAYHPGNTRLGGKDTTGHDDLLTIAVARLMLDNIPHIKAYWVMLGVKIAQLAIAFGANDLDGTVMEEHICHMANGDAPQSLSEMSLRQLIQQAGGQPVRRDSRHQFLDDEMSEDYATHKNHDVESLGVSREMG